MQRCAVVAAAIFAGCGGSDHEDAVRVDLTGFQGFLYAAPMTIGGQTFQVQVDTGSTTAAVAGSSCGNCGVTPEYAPGTGASDTHQTGSTTYGDGSMWTGEIFSDKASAGTTADVALDFVSITSQTMYFQGNAYQGILGLGPADLLDAHTTSFATQTFAKGYDAELAFELCVDTGAMFIGGFDDALASSPPAYTAMLPLSSANGFYAVHLESLGLGSAVFASEGDIGNPIVDTGTSLTYLPTTAFNALVSAVTASPGFTSLFGGQQFGDDGCVTTPGVTDDMVDAMVPPLAVTVVGATTAVDLAPSRTFLVASGDTAGQYCLAFDDAGSLGSGVPPDFGVLGDSFMAGALTVFDIANNRIGFAPDIGCNAAGSGSAAASARARAPRVPGRPWWDGSPYFRPPPAPRH